MKRSTRTRVVIVGDDGTAMFASAADRLDWKVVGAAGATAGTIRAETGAKVVDLERLIATVDTDVAIVGTSAERRCTDATRLIGRGVGVVLIPDGLAGHPLPAANDRLVIGDPVPMAPASQRWMKVLRELTDVERVWLMTTPARSLSACSLAVLASRILRWPSADQIEIGVTDKTLPTFEAQASGPTDAVTMTLFPSPLVEHNGIDVSPPPTRHPADAFGTTDLLRRFVGDLSTRSTPILGTDFFEAVRARQANL